jgi:signal transduction histidine kinase/CheY-like chemotaxis protein
MAPSAAGESDLVALSLHQYLDHDPRPTFVLDIGARVADDVALQPAFCNKALVDDEALLRTIVAGTPLDSSERTSRRHRHYRRWLFDTRPPPHPDRANAEYGGVCWSTYVVEDHYRVVAANVCRHQSDTNSSSRSTHSRTLSSSNISGARLASHSRNALHDPKPPPTVEDQKIAFSDDQLQALSADWTAKKPKGRLTQHEEFARSTDWGITPLGSISSWTPEFRDLANLVMHNPHPCALFWGQELTMLYNDAYRIEVAGNKHPVLMGSGFFGPFGELWSGVKALFEECARTGQSIRKENDRLLIERYGYLEETFFSWSFVPMYDKSAHLLGFYNAPFETTYQTVSSRRMETLQRLGEEVAGARSVSQFWKGVIAGLETNPYDIVFATVYSVGEFEGSDSASNSSSSNILSKRGTLQGTIGVPAAHPAALGKVDFQSVDGMIPHLRDAVLANAPILLRDEDGTLPEILLDGIQFGGFEIPSKEVLVIPVTSTNGENTLGILTVGLNPRRQYDHDYQTFIAMLIRQLTTTLASIMAAEDEARKNRTAAEVAALQQERLTEELALQTSRQQRMTELSPLGMFLISPDGVLLEANDRYYEMTNNAKEQSSMSFMETVHESNMPLAIQMWTRLTAERKVVSEEILMNYNYNTEIDETTNKPIEPWVLASALPEIGQDGEIRSVMGSITDISHLHYARRLQDQRLREAEETKIQQNAFIDITSHEMRNPLSAVLICADDIRESLQQHHFNDDCLKVVTECIEAANTISLCVQHQKSIVDDILTISKLNSNLLVICPQPTQPVNVIQQAMNMFRNETQSKRIDLSLHLHPSMRDLYVDWVMLDPGRVLQMTVNLLTNAIKFTQQSPTRSISVHIGASLSPPIAQTKSFDYVPVREPLPEHDIVAGPEWGSGSELFIRVRVTDTGCGLSPDEKQRLFERFAQASPRTHAQYGGSGLGLFISRQLAELHGGQIGAASEAGVGSTFGFFIQCRRTTDPDTATSAGSPKVASATATERPDPVPVQGDDPQASVGARQKVNISDSQLTSHAETIPLTPGPEPSLRRPLMKPISEQSGSPTNIVDPSRKIHVLIVEDNLVNQRIVRKQLEKAGCIVSTADNGVLALEYLKTTDLYTSSSSTTSASHRRAASSTSPSHKRTAASRPAPPRTPTKVAPMTRASSPPDRSSPHPINIILMDLEMPEMGGLECVTHIRRLEAEGTIKRHIPVVAVTANVRPEQMMDARKVGMDDIVSKPFRIKELVQRIEGWVGVGMETGGGSG